MWDDAGIEIETGQDKKIPEEKRAVVKKFIESADYTKDVMGVYVPGSKYISPEVLKLLDTTLKDKNNDTSHLGYFDLMDLEFYDISDNINDYSDSLVEDLISDIDTDDERLNDSNNDSNNSENDAMFDSDYNENIDNELNGMKNDNEADLDVKTEMKNESDNDTDEDYNGKSKKKGKKRKLKRNQNGLCLFVFFSCSFLFFI